MTPAALSRLLDVVSRKAPALRKAGVRKLSAAGVELTLEPHVDLEALKSAVKAAVQGPQDPLQDPATYGLPDGSRLPGFDFDDEQS